jgi:uncharacterized repeat protein (TIGR03843 family)
MAIPAPATTRLTKPLSHLDLLVPSPKPSSPENLSAAEAIAVQSVTQNVDVLRDGIMSIDGRMPWSSNATFLVTLTAPDDLERSASTEPTELAKSVESVEEALASGRAVKAIYKPHKGERPLWDFPSGLYQREVAMYELAAYLGWDVIPRTVLRDGDFGIGSVQLFVDADFDQHYFTLMESIGTRKSLLPALRTLTTLDLLANNADRKSGHVLVDGNNGIWGIDHGLCFHEEFKLRTVLWDFAGDRIPKALSPAIAKLADATPGSLGALDDLLNDEEIRVLIERARKLVRKPTFPAPHSDYAYPWPMV